MSTVADNLRTVAASIPEGVELVAVSKFHPVERLREAYDAGQRVFGESRAAELASKAAQMPSDVRWHFIGHLQTNKVRLIMPHVAMIQSVDSLRLLRLIDSEAARIGRRADVLLEVCVSADETKTGMRPADFDALLEEWTPGSTPAVNVRGIMGMASLTDDEEIIRADFKALRAIFNRLRDGLFAGNASFDTLSMGMSDDRDIAIDCGSTMVRVGTDIFGEREY